MVSATTIYAPIDGVLTELSVREGAAITEGAPLFRLNSLRKVWAIAQVPDDPPSQFHWAGEIHRVRRADGPERIAYEWWRQTRPEDRAELHDRVVERIR